MLPQASVALTQAQGELLKCFWLENKYFSVQPIKEKRKQILVSSSQTERDLKNLILLAGMRGLCWLHPTSLLQAIQEKGVVFPLLIQS